MQRTTVFFIIFQILLLGMSTNVHSIDLSHDKHDGAHVHFDDFKTDSSNLGGSHDSDAHFHFSFILLMGSNNFHQPLFTESWHSRGNDNFLSKTYSPSVPPPNPAS